MGRCKKNLLTPSGLTPKQDKFINNYIESGNGTQSAIDAGYSPKTAYSIANENLSKPEVGMVIAQRFLKHEVSADRVLKVISDRLDSEDDVIALKAAELAGKHLRMFTDKVDHTIVFEKLRGIGWSDGGESVDETFVDKGDNELSTDK